MATTAHAIYCFEVLSASLEKRHALELHQVEDLWARYQLANGSTDETDKLQHNNEADDSDMGEDGDEEDEDEDDDPVPPTLRHPSLSRLQALSSASASASSSSSSTPSSLSTTSSQIALDNTSKSSSKSSFFSIGRSKQPSPIQKDEEHPLFITWNTLSSRDHKSLRGCIGTFDAQPLPQGLKSYALTAAFDDTRFPPIARSELSSLSCTVTLLTSFTPCAHPLDWTLGTHGIRINFSDKGKRYSSTYLPDVAPEQGWNKEETLLSLMRKAGWSGGGRGGRSWRDVQGLRVVRYEGKKGAAGWREFREFGEWSRGKG